jgi:hypothetical protein
MIRLVGVNDENRWYASANIDHVNDVGLLLSV